MTPLTIVEPEGTPRGGIVVLQEAFGVNGHIEDLCHRLASDGWLAVAPHLFHRSGDPKLGYENVSLVYPHMNALDAGSIRTDFEAALDLISSRELETSRIGVVGFCMGGYIALVMASRYDLGASVTFYGSGIAEGRFGLPSLLDAAPQLRCPWLGLFGDHDPSIPVDDIEALREAARTSKVSTEIVRYGDAGHGFCCDQRSSYHQPSAVDGWDRMSKHFARYLTSGSSGH